MRCVKLTIGISWLGKPKWTKYTLDLSSDSSVCCYRGSFDTLFCLRFDKYVEPRITIPPKLIIHCKKAGVENNTGWYPSRATPISVILTLHWCYSNTLWSSSDSQKVKLQVKWHYRVSKQHPKIQHQATPGCYLVRTSMVLFLTPAFLQCTQAFSFLDSYIILSYHFQSW